MEFSDTRIIKKNFEWIKQQLDPAMGYLIFENDLDKQAGTIFSSSLRIYHLLKKANFRFKQVWDTKRRKEFLVIQIEPGFEDEILGNVMGCGFSKEIVTYFYKAETKTNE